MMNPTKYDLSELRADDVRQYKPTERLIIWEWYCRHCKERIGYPYMPATHATVCEDPGSCPRMDRQTGAPCGDTVCAWCHTPAVRQTIEWTDPEAVESVAADIGLDGRVSFL